MRSVQIFILIVLLVLSPALLGAESIEYRGITLPVTSIEMLGGDIVKVELFNETRVLNQKNVGSYLLAQYAKERSRAAILNKTELKEAVLENLDDISFFREVFTVLENADPAFAKEIIIKLSKTDRAGPLVTEVASSAIGFINQEKAALFLVAAGLHDSSFIGIRMRPEELLFREGLPAAIDTFLSDAAEELNIIRLYKIIELGGHLDLPQKDYLLELKETIQQVEDAISKDDIKQVYDLVDRHRSAHIYGSVYQPILYKAITEAAQKRATTKPLEALQLIATIDFSKRTPAVHKIVQVALNSIYSIDEVVYDLRLDLMLRSFAVKDPLIAEIYLSKLDSLFLRQLKERNSGLEGVISHSLQRITSIRQDPNDKNDRLRLAAAIALTKLGQRSQALVLLLERESKLTILEQARLFISGYYIPRWILIIVALIIIILVSLYLKVRFATKIVSTNTKTRTTRETIEEPISGEGFKNRKVSSLPPDFDVGEYQSYLNVFGLPVDCDERDIKKSYREAVKEHHPDMQKDSRANERFIELTQAYERLLELYKKQRQR